MTTKLDEAIQEIDDWIDETDTPEGRLGLLACANLRAIERIKSGTAQVGTLRQVLDYIQVRKAEIRRVKGRRREM